MSFSVSEHGRPALQKHQQAWTWTLLLRFHELPKVYVLEFAGFDMLVVPRRAFACAAQDKQWAAMIRNRVGTGTDG